MSARQPISRVQILKLLWSLGQDELNRIRLHLQKETVNDRKAFTRGALERIADERLLAEALQRHYANDIKYGLIDVVRNIKRPDLCRRILRDDFIFYPTNGSADSTYDIEHFDRFSAKRRDHVALEVGYVLDDLSSYELGSFLWAIDPRLFRSSASITGFDAENRVWGHVSDKSLYLETVVNTLCELEWDPVVKTLIDRLEKLPVETFETHTGLGVLQRPWMYGVHLEPSDYSVSRIDIFHILEALGECELLSILNSLECERVGEQRPFTRGQLNRVKDTMMLAEVLQTHYMQEIKPALIYLMRSIKRTDLSERIMRGRVSANFTKADIPTEYDVDNLKRFEGKRRDLVAMEVGYILDDLGKECFKKFLWIVYPPLKSSRTIVTGFDAEKAIRDHVTQKRPYLEIVVSALCEIEMLESVQTLIERLGKLPDETFIRYEPIV